MIRKFAKRAAAVAVAVPLALAATAVPASANDAGADSADGYVWACWRTSANATLNGGCVTFYQYGEVLLAEDFQADGWGTRGQIQKWLPDSNGVYRWVNHSSDCFDDTSTGNTSAGRTSCQYSIAEGVKVRVHVWASRSGTYAFHNYSPSISA
ncbi:hypothetical protein ACGF7U_01460 [Micromonospora sp. NPDC047670]|uniref:hypothetical protein n=1 Tax=Micromonospora sp. NPDC047670 TaxID=3364252 RepID=UPI003714FDF9